MAEQPTPEQLAEMKEKMKNMSPEELKKLQKEQCIFCKIISGEVTSKKVYEDEHCMAILDINPANPGHILLMPKEHYPLMPLIPEEILNHMFIVTKALSKVMLTAVNAEGTDIFIANGSAAGQRAQHFMLHVIPRRNGDEVPMNIPYKEGDENEIKEIANTLREKINAIFKIKQETVSAYKKEIEKEEVETSKEENVKKEEVEKEISVKKKTSKKSEKKSTPKKKPVKGKFEKKEEVDLDDIASLLG